MKLLALFVVVVPLVLNGGEPASPSGKELVYVQDGWVTGLSGHRYYRGVQPAWCEGLVYVVDGGIYREGEYVTEGMHPQCWGDVMMFVRGGYVWKREAGVETRLMVGKQASISADGRIAYVANYLGTQSVYLDGQLLWQGTAGDPRWAEDLYFYSNRGLVRWDGVAHVLSYSGRNPVWAPEGLYYTWGPDLYRDGVLVVENASQPAY
jgi:hypothetical protein